MNISKKSFEIPTDVSKHGPRRVINIPNDQNYFDQPHATTDMKDVACSGTYSAEKDAYFMDLGMHRISVYAGGHGFMAMRSERLLGEAWMPPINENMDRHNFRHPTAQLVAYMHVQWKRAENGACRDFVCHLIHLKSI